MGRQHSIYFVYFIISNGLLIGRVLYRSCALCIAAFNHRCYDTFLFPNTVARTTVSAKCHFTVAVCISNCTRLFAVDHHQSTTPSILFKQSKLGILLSKRLEGVGIRFIFSILHHNSYTAFISIYFCYNNLDYKFSHVRRVQASYSAANCFLVFSFWQFITKDISNSRPDESHL